jgi:4-hydroxy-3-methylbut-2-enyl diphosphate reductase
MKRIEVAKTAGFCFGVNRAVSMCEALLSAGRSIVTLGEIIHNATVVERLAGMGCVAVETPQDTPPGATLVVRSHGVGQVVFDDCAARGIQYADATCPFVAKIHQIVRRYGDDGYSVLIAGDADHAEVRGIVGHCTGPAFVFSNLSQLMGLLTQKIGKDDCILVAQTTFNLLKYTECVDYIKKTYTNIRVFDTICNATRARQQEAEQLSKSSDVCVVIGGQNSSNTGKLYDVCARNAVTYRIEGPNELSAQMFAGANAIGITAGASTPAPLIEEVRTKMEEMIKDEAVVEEKEKEALTEAAAQPVAAPSETAATQEEEEAFDFERALEDSMRVVRRGQRIQGVVTSVMPNEVVVDIGTKHTGFIPLDELSDDSSAKPEDVVQVGETINLVVIKVQDLEGFVTLSKKRVDSEKGMEDLAKGVEDGTIFDAYVTEAVNKGLVAMVKGVRVFIPASQATLRRGEPYEQLVRSHQKIKILEVNPARRRAIGSVRAVLDIENEKKREVFWNEIEVDKKYTGIVKSLTTYGAFVDLGGVDGMIHKSELSWSRVAKTADIVQIGQEVEVYVKDFDPETRKISLGYRDEADNPWNKIQEYEIGTEFEAPVVSVTAFGAFVRVLPGVDGLVHLSEMSTEHIKAPGDLVKVGDTVKVRLIGVDFEKKRISLSMKPNSEADLPKEASAEQPQENAAPETQAAEEIAAAQEAVADAPEQEAAPEAEA